MYDTDITDKLLCLKLKTHQLGWLLQCYGVHVPHGIPRRRSPSVWCGTVTNPTNKHLDKADTCTNPPTYTTSHMDRSDRAEH
jgi:hypothetical protein